MENKIIEIKNTSWNLKPLFDGDNDPSIEEKRKEIKQKSYEFIDKWKDREDYLGDPTILKEALDEYEDWQRNYGSGGDEGYYFWLRTQQDSNNPELKAKLNNIEDFGNKIKNDIQFFELNIAKIPAEKQKEFLNSEALKDYKHFLELLFKSAKHILSDAEEKILTLKSATSHFNWVRMLSGFISKEEREVVLDDGDVAAKNFSEILGLIDSKNKKVRDSAALALNDIFRKNIDVAEAEINSVLANKKTDDELRSYSRPDASRHLSDDIDSDVVDALVDSVSKKFDIAKKYYELKAKLMGVPKLEYHERNVPIGEIDKNYNFEEAANLVYKTFANIDKEFSDIFKGFVDNGQIDVLSQKGKKSGAFCSYNLLIQPTFLLLNHTGKLNDVLTLAHELGHGINDELMRNKQNALNFGTPISTAEVASTFMEDFVLAEILKEADDELRLAIMMMKLNSDVSTIFRQIAFYKFEQDLHNSFREKGYLSKEEIGKLFQKHMISYMGDFVEQSSGSENWWSYIGHFRSFFYVYSYASGLLISKSLQNSFAKNRGFIGKVKEFLSAGCSNSPKNIFKNLGIDITDKNFWDSGLTETENLLNETIDLAKKLGKI